MIVCAARCAARPRDLAERHLTASQSHTWIIGYLPLLSQVLSAELLWMEWPVVVRLLAVRLELGLAAMAADELEAELVGYLRDAIGVPAVGTGHGCLAFSSRQFTESMVAWFSGPNPK